MGDNFCERDTNYLFKMTVFFRENFLEVSIVENFVDIDIV